MNIHFSSEPAPTFKQLLDSELCTPAELTFAGTPPATTEVLVNGHPNRETLSSLPNLKAVVIPFAGLSEHTRQVLLDYPTVGVYNLHHNASSTAEMAIGLMISAMKRIQLFDAQLKKGRWAIPGENLEHTSLAGKKVLVLGYGSIGQKVAAVCKAFDMEVFAVKRTPPTDHDGSITFLTDSEWRQQLPEIDVLQLCLPYTPATKEIIGPNEIAKLPNRSVVINTARGGLIHEQAFYHALKDRSIAGAGIDVWWNYPKDRAKAKREHPSNFPFRKLPNVIMTPHRAADFGDLALEQRRTQHLITLLNDLITGKEPATKVNVEHGY